MGKHDRVLARLCAKPTPSDVKWAELKALLEHLNYKLLNNSGSRRKFYNGEKNALIICHQPHPDPNVDKGCIADVVNHLKEHGFV